MDEYDIFSESSNEFEYINKNDLISKFMSDNIDNIIDFYDNLKDKFRLSPFFLDKMQSFDITYILIILLYEDIRSLNFVKKSDHKTQTLYSTFIREYYNEIDYSYKLFTKFLKYYKVSIDFDSWSDFCFAYSHLDF